MGLAICHGKPCTRGHRIWVSLILGLLADGMSIEEVLAQYPGLEPDEVRACMAYAALSGRLWIAEVDRVREYQERDE